QHALRAFTPRDAKALKAAVTTYPKTKDYDLEEDLTQLGTGEAMITILSERGAPTPVVWTKLRPPQSLMAALETADVDRLARDASIWPTYAEEVDRESAREKLAGRLAEAAAVVAEVPREEPPPRRPAQPKGRGRKESNPVVGYLKSREGRSMINTVARGVFGLLRKRR
ncbi:MAG TPA: helicase HerA-like domain-containing protein, partial [Acidimicrobiia bacterium]|nr:helicase HerA-like domain-containing protein [Acidimicrobiia bacterium]